eukprot:4678399-Pyramimonas_sp.AAC.1
MAKLPDSPFEEDRALPWAAAKRARSSGADSMEFEIRAVWLEFCGWRRSAAQCASAVELWGEAAAISGEAPCPPGHSTVCVFS